MADSLYDAFLSYSHRDVRWAKWLQSKLEHFAISRSLREEMQEQKKELRVFRDQTDLTGVELQASLEQELRRSRCLIVICSRSSAASPWVNEEIRYFRSLGREDSIIPFIVDGEPESSSPELECYPPALLDREGKHFLGANIREIGREKAFLKVLAVLLGVRFDRLVNRRRKARIRMAAAVGAVALTFLTAVSVLAWRNSRLAHQNEALTDENQELTYGIFATALLRYTRTNEISEEDVTFIEASARAGNPDAMLLMADCCRYGMGTEQDPVRAYEWYSRAAEAGNTEAMTDLGQCYWEGIGVGKSREDAFAWFLRAAEAGDAEAMTYTGQCYYFGYGTETDDAQAFAWLHSAAEQGRPLAMFYMSLFYQQGIGTEPDDETSFFWMARMAETGDPLAMYTLGTMYQNGFGTPEDPGAALYWYQRSANTGDEDAKVRAAECLERQYGTSELMLQWYREAALAGQADAADALTRLGITLAK